MKAWICPRYGAPEVLRLVELPEPTPGPREVVVRVEATSVSTADARVRGCRFPAGMRFVGRLALGWRGPRQAVLGTDCAGVVESIGRDVRHLREGDAVLVVKGAAMGCHAERILVRPRDVVVPKPAELSWADAVSLPFGGQTARFFLRKAGLRGGHEVLIIGASGAVGSAAVQLVALAGARAIAVTRAENTDWTRALGAVETIDYTSSDYVAAGRRYDLVMDCVGAGSFRTMRHLVKRGGAYLAVAGGLADMLARGSGGVRCVTGYVPESTGAVEELLRHVREGAFRPVVGRRFGFADLPAAHAYVDSGRKRGTAVVDVASLQRPAPTD
jgi:NADPH:quinone reductase-like Zn-dependent oxidoreductase